MSTPFTYYRARRDRSVPTTGTIRCQFVSSKVQVFLTDEIDVFTETVTMEFVTSEPITPDTDLRRVFVRIGSGFRPMPFPLLKNSGFATSRAFGTGKGSRVYVCQSSLIEPHEKTSKITLVLVATVRQYLACGSFCPHCERNYYTSHLN